MHRTALTDKALVAADERTVSVTYRDSHTGQPRCMTLPAQEFLRRFLQHVPAKGLHRVRAYGLLHPAHRDALRRLQLMLAQHAPAVSLPEPAQHHQDASRPSRARCASCGTPTLRLLRALSPEQCLRLAALGVKGIEQARAPPQTARVPT